MPTIRFKGEYSHITLTTPKLKIFRPKINKAYFATATIEEVTTTSTTETVPELYVVAFGDTLSKIASKKGTTVDAIIESNEALTEVNKNKIKVGQKITLPTTIEATETNKKITFTKVNESTIGTELYVIVETDGFQGYGLYINIKQGKEKGVEEVDELITFKNEGGQYITKGEVKVGALCETHYINADDYADIAILKVTIDHNDKEKKDAWLKNLDEATDKKTHLYLLAEGHTVPGQEEININYFGDSEGGEIRGEAVNDQWLDSDGNWFMLGSGERAPWMEIAHKELGTEEIEGKKHNSRILEYHKSAGVEDYKNSKGQAVKITDDKGWPWCSSFACWVFEQTPDFSGKITAKATNWKNWGKSSSKDKPMYGALAVIDWGKNDNRAGHVGFIVNADENNYYLLGGNQTGGDKTTNGKVCVGKYKKSHIDYIRIPDNYTPTENDYKYDKIKSTNDGFESLASTR